MNDRKIDYPTGSENGMSFICNRWVFTGPQGYRVQFVGLAEGAPEDSERVWSVYSYAGSHTTPAWYDATTRHMTEDDAHAYAARLAKTTPHPGVDVAPEPEPEHTCGPGIQYGCDVPDCDAENGD